MSNKMISFLHFGKTQQIERQVINNFDLDADEVKGLLDDLREDFSDRLKQTEIDITEGVAEKISRMIECKFIEIICKVNEMPSVTEEKVKQAVQQCFHMLRENSGAFVSDLQNQFNEIKDRELTVEENLTNLCNQIAWQSDEAFNNLFEMVAPLKNIKWDFSYELQEGWVCLKRADFDHAKELFEKATGQKDIMAEAYFGLALADCKIQTIWDYKNCRVQPLCYDYSIEFSENPHYKLALKNATEAQKNEYKNFEKEIEHIQKEFEYLESSGLDYDCFICVKIKDNGEKTEDSKDADNIYHLLQRKGHKPFYSDYEIRNKKGAEYEAHILYALYKSKCMLLVCRNKEYLRTPWVKNEYMRFMKMIDDGEKKRGSLVIVFYGKMIERFPGRTGRLEGIDFADPMSAFDIVEFVDRQTQKETERLKAEAAARNVEEQRKAEAAARKEEEELKKKLWLAPDYPTLEHYDETEFKIERGVLKDYLKKDFSGEVKIPRGVTSIGDYSFYDCSGLTSIIIPNSVERIGDYAFYGCRGLTSITIPDSVESIGDFAFHDCRGLTSITIPDSVESIGDYAFHDCSGLTSITIPDSVESIGNDAFRNCSGLTSIIIPASVKSIGKCAFWGCSGLMLVKIPESVTQIGTYAFDYCKNLTIYCEASEQPSGWHENWNPDNCPVVWGYRKQ